MRTETFEDLCSVVVKQREEIKALRDALKSHATCCWHDLARAQDAQLQKITRELDEAITEDRAAREDAVKRAEADRVRIERLREERDQFRAKLEAATGADHTVPAAVPQHGVIGKTVRHSTGRVGRVMSVKTDWVDGHGWTLYAVQRSDGVAGSQIWHASNCTIVEEKRDAQSALVAEQRRLLAAKQTEIGALEAERDDLRKIVEMVHADLGIQRGDHVGEAISELKKEASDATARQRMTEARALNYSLQADEARREIERLRAKLNAKTEPVAEHTQPAVAVQS